MKTLTRHEIIKRMKIEFDQDFGFMYGWIGSHSGTKSDNNNLGGYITTNMVLKLETEGIIKYLGFDDIWILTEDYEIIQNLIF